MDRNKSLMVIDNALEELILTYQLIITKMAYRAVLKQEINRIDSEIILLKKINALNNQDKEKLKKSLLEKTDRTLRKKSLKAIYHEIISFLRGGGDITGIREELKLNDNEIKKINIGNKTILESVNYQDFYTGKKPNQAIIEISKLSQTSYKRIPEQTSIKPIEAFIRVSPRDRPLTQISFSLNIPEWFTTARKLTLEDIMLENAIGNLYETCGSVFTSAQVYKALNGINEDITIKEETLEEIDNRIRRLSQIWCKIDFKAQVELYNKKHEDKPIESGKIEGHILNCDYVEVVFKNGEKKAGWRLLSCPKLYQYSKTIGQIKTYPIRVLQSSSRRNQIKTNIRFYILQQIARISQNKGATITYDSILEAIDDQAALSDKRYRFKRIVMINEILDDIKNIKYDNGLPIITKWKEIKEDNKSHGVYIETPQQD